MSFARRSLLPVALLVLISSGCSDDSTDPDDGVNVAGSWSGVSAFPTPFSTSMTLQQNGTGVTGQMSVSGSFIGRAVTGAVDNDTHTFTWGVVHDCQVWGGVMSVSGDGDEMTGSVVVNRAGCVPAQSNSSGTLTLSRQ